MSSPLNKLAEILLQKPTNNVPTFNGSALPIYQPSIETAQNPMDTQTGHDLMARIAGGVLPQNGQAPFNGFNKLVSGLMNGQSASNQISQNEVPPPIPYDVQSDQVPPSGYVRPDVNNPGEIAAPAIKPVVEENPPALLSPIDQLKQKVTGLQNEQIVNKDHGFKGVLKEIAQNILGGIADTAQNNPDASIGTLLGGGLGKGIGGGIDRTANERRSQQMKLQKLMNDLAIQSGLKDKALEQEARKVQIDEIKRRPEKEAEAWKQRVQIENEKNKAKVEAATIAFNRRMEALDKQQQFEGNQWEKYVDGNGKVWKKYKDGRSEPAIFNGEQDTDPSKMTYDVYDPVTEKTVKATGGQILGYSGAIQQGNATREQQANIQNAQFDIETQKTNVKNMMDFNGQVVSLANQIAKESKNMNENLAEMNGYNTELQAANQELAGVDPAANPERYNKLVDKVNNLSGKVFEAAGKTESGAKALNELKARGIQPPQLVKAPKVQPVKINTGKPVPKSKDPLGLFQ